MSTPPGSAGSPAENDSVDAQLEIVDEQPDASSAGSPPEQSPKGSSAGSLPEQSRDQSPEQPVATLGSSAPARRPRWWVAVATFGAGVVVGILIVGLLSASTPGFLTEARSGGNTPAPGVPSGSVQVAVEAQVNAACLRVINEAQDVYGALTGLDDAVDAVDLQQLDDIARRLQPIQPRLARDLSDCEVRVNSGSDPTASGSSSPVVPRPSASPTG